MAYSTGAPIDIDDLFGDLQTFATSNGFTLSGTNYSKTYNSATYKFFALVKNGIYYGFAYHATNGDLFMNTSTGWATATNLESQAGCAYRNARCNIIGSSPVSYYFFADSNCIHVAVERSTNVFAHFSFGEITKFGTGWTGGAFVSGCNWRTASGTGTPAQFNPWDSNTYHCRPFDYLKFSSVYVSYPSHIRVDHLTYNSASFGEHGYTNQTWVRTAAYGTGTLDSHFILDNSPNAFNSRAVLCPINFLLAAEDGTATPTGWIPLGKVSNAAHVNIEALNAKDVVLTDWMVFPIAAKNSSNLLSDGYPNTGNYGIAYKK